MADSSYISKEDYKYQIRTGRLNQILESTDEDEDMMLDNAETEALGMIRKYLSLRYNMDYEFSLSGSSRNTVVMRMAKVLVVYYIYERIPDEMVPDRVIHNYKEVMDMLEKVECGDSQIPGLKPVETTGSTGETKPYTKRRWGSVPSRANDGGSPRELKY